MKKPLKKKHAIKRIKDLIGSNKISSIRCCMSVKEHRDKDGIVTYAPCDETITINIVQS